ncbi:MAG: hypothetical protein HBSAPP03_09040 [Phycisphaerae bacterium]|nr:MAG: hypothetical protein HBSAPP03_09040 [Phycisphaerae bacterium]
MTRACVPILAAIVLAGCTTRRDAPIHMTDRPLWADSIKSEIQSGSDRAAWERKAGNVRDHVRWDVPWPRPTRRP